MLILVSYPLLVTPLSTDALTPEQEKASEMFDEAIIHFKKGQYRQAISVYDEILDTFPENISTLKMKGIALSNLGNHKNSLIAFFKILQNDDQDVIALAGMGLGFGNLGEYQESKMYFDQALALEPDNIVFQNYKNFVERVIKKYPYTPTEKPLQMQTIQEKMQIPPWIKNNAGWWAKGQISDSDFVAGIGHLINVQIIEIPPKEQPLESLKQKQDQEQQLQQTSQKIPDWIKTNAGWWAQGQIGDSDFVAGIQYLMANGIMVVSMASPSPVVAAPELLVKQRAEELKLFEKYLDKISKNVASEKRYIEYPNPSGDVIKKFLRDYIKWNYTYEAKIAADTFPNPASQLVNGTVEIHYWVFVNEQPTGLPLDHVATLDNSLAFWENQEFTVKPAGQGQPDQKGKVKFKYTTLKSEANIWVTWTVRDLGDGVLGHAHLGKGVVEVALGDYSCDGEFQLYDVKTVEKIMTHELGHSIGLRHIEDPDNIMNPSMPQKYAYCLLN